MHRSGSSLAAVAGTLAFVTLMQCNAQDRVFNYTYQSTVLSRGERELEIWNTVRWGREAYYREFDHRMEFEVGLGGNLQTAFYLNISSVSAISTAGSIAVLNSETEYSFSNEWKFKLADPVADPLGLALYGEYAISSKGFELEPRLILDKSFGPVLFALNTAGEFEFERAVAPDGAQTTERETGVELDIGASFAVTEGLSVGFETMTSGGFSGGALEYATLFAGPTISFAQDKFWVNLTLLPQVVALKGATSGSLDLDDVERIHTRLIFSYAF
jgi:hypothetical protein